MLAGHLNQQEKALKSRLFCVLPTFIPSTDAQATDAQDIFYV